MTVLEQELTAETGPELDQLKRAATYTLGDAIREGAASSEQLFYGFGRDDRSCALQAGINAAKARGYM